MSVSIITTLSGSRSHWFGVKCPPGVFTWRLELPLAPCVPAGLQPSGPPPSAPLQRELLEGTFISVSPRLSVRGTLTTSSYKVETGTEVSEERRIKWRSAVTPMAPSSTPPRLGTKVFLETRSSWGCHPETKVRGLPRPALSPPPFIFLQNVHQGVGGFLAFFSLSCPHGDQGCCPPAR